MNSLYLVKLRSIENKYKDEARPIEISEMVYAPDEFAAAILAKSKASDAFCKIFKAVHVIQAEKDSSTPTRRLIDPSGFREACLLFLDLETTGLDLKTEAIVQVGFIAKQAGADRLDDEGYQSYVHPNGVPNGAHAINKISDEDLENAPTLQEVWETALMPAIKAADMIVFHNRCFDFEMLIHNLRRANISRDQYMWPSMFCTKEMAIKALGLTSKESRLYGVAQKYGYMPFEPHKAINDALATAFIFEKMIDKDMPLSKLMDICDRGL